MTAGRGEFEQLLKDRGLRVTRQRLKDRKSVV